MAKAWNGEYDVSTVNRVYTDEEAAAAYVENKNDNAFGSYATMYEYEEYETED